MAWIPYCHIKYKSNLINLIFWGYFETLGMVPLKFMATILMTWRSFELQILYTNPLSELLPMYFRDNLTVELYLLLLLSNICITFVWVILEN